jgi:branched-chain amino acid transport system ATP-binding protein
VVTNVDDTSDEAGTDETANGRRRTGSDVTATDGGVATADATDAGDARDPLLELDSVTAGYGNTTVIHDVSFAVERGEVACLIGPNGSGKSTVMKSIYGFADVFGGQVTFDGEDVTALAPEESLRTGMSYVLQDASVFPDMTVHENMLMGGFVFDDDDRAEARVEELYDEFGRLADLRAQKAGTLSGGQRRLLELARALMVEPELMLLDEPSIGLEPRYIDDVFERIRQLNDLGTTILLVEQNAEKGLSVADTGLVLASGQIEFTGTGTELLEDEEIGRLYLGG